MIVADDLGYGDSQAWYAQSDKQTPTLNALAQQGVKFTRFYTDSTCSTSRASLLTGQHPTRLGFHPVARGIPTELTTLPEYLQRQGYHTALIGKWHVGELYQEALPNAQGFDYFFGYLNQWFLQGPAADGALQLKAPTYYHPWLVENSGALQAFDGYLPELLTLKTEQWLADQKADKPWFLLYATPLPHGPIVAPPDVQAQGQQAIYRAMVKRFDEDLTRVLAALEHTGQRDNTLIIVLSDNGAPDKLAGSNAGFAGGKWSYSEGAVRVPMLWLWPNKFPPKAQLNPAETVFIADIYPSLVSYLQQWGASEPPEQIIDGRDLFTQTAPVALNWMSRNSYSRLENNERYSGNWIFRTWIERQRETLSETGSNGERISEKQSAAVEARFSAWLDDVSRTALIKAADGSYRGNDFLRTPLKDWDFYIALKPELAGENQLPQWLAGQKGSWRVYWDGKLLNLDMHGGSWQVRLPADGKCHLLGINADLYDRFTNLGADINLSRVTVTLDAIERLDAKWQIEDLSGVNVTEPLYVGKTPEKSFSAWQGQASEPIMYHRGNRAGEWAFWLDEKALKQRLCAEITSLQ